jgi:hypothetical protein
MAGSPFSRLLGAVDLPPDGTDNESTIFVTQLVGYAVLDFPEDELSVTKVTGYTILDVPPEVAVSTLNPYAVLEPSLTELTVATLNPYAVLEPSLTELTVSNLNTYAVIYPGYYVGDVLELHTAGTYQEPNVPDTITYQWQRSTDGTTWSDIIGETGVIYTIVPADLWYFIALAEIAANQGGTTITRSQSLRVVES